MGENPVGDIVVVKNSVPVGKEGSGFYRNEIRWFLISDNGFDGSAGGFGFSSVTAMQRHYNKYIENFILKQKAGN